jgi:hypothetical protein
MPVEVEQAVRPKRAVAARLKAMILLMFLA